MSDPISISVSGRLRTDKTSCLVLWCCWLGDEKNICLVKTCVQQFLKFIPWGPVLTWSNSEKVGWLNVGVKIVVNVDRCNCYWLLMLNYHAHMVFLLQKSRLFKCQRFYQWSKHGCGHSCIWTGGMLIVFWLKFCQYLVTVNDVVYISKLPH